jgi:ribonuclease HI
MKSLTIYTDGACQPNPGPCGCGVVILDENEEIVCLVSEYIGHGTNNVGELTGILRALTRAKELGVADVKLYTDSEVCLKLLRKKSTKVMRLQHILERCLVVMEGMTVNAEWVKGHDGVKWNELADRLANASLAFLNVEATLMDVKLDAQSPSSWPIKTSDAVLHLNCPFAQKDEAKQMGARWDSTSKKWTVKDTPDNRARFSKWLQT